MLCDEPKEPGQRHRRGVPTCEYEVGARIAQESVRVHGAALLGGEHHEPRKQVGVPRLPLRQLRLALVDHSLSKFVDDLQPRPDRDQGSAIEGDNGGRWSVL